MKSELHRSIRRNGFRNMFLFLLCAVMIVLVMVGFFRRSIVSGHSMDPTLHDGQNLLLMSTRLNPLLNVAHGDIVVAEYGDLVIVKRVIGCPGDTVEIRGGQVYLNGSALSEPYICEPMTGQDMSAVTLAEEAFFLMGDNRNRSADSRVFGTFSRQELVGIIYMDRQPLLWAILVLLILSFVLMAASLGYNEKEENAYA